MLEAPDFETNPEKAANRRVSEPLVEAFKIVNEEIENVKKKVEPSAG
jgi:hypothetical protein